MRILRRVVTASVSALVLFIPTPAAFARPRTPPAPTVGYDVSYPQCSGALPDNPLFGIVGVSDGLAYGENPCLASQYAWAARAPQVPAFYMNTGNPGSQSTRVSWYGQAGPLPCGPADEAGCAYDYGYNGAAQAFALAGSQVGTAPAAAAMWWLDVETANSWSSDSALNRRDIQGSVDYLTSQGVAIGVYSTPYQWSQITNGMQLGGTVANWVAGALNVKRAPSQCSPSFSGGPVVLVQYPSAGFDADYVC